MYRYIALVWQVTNPQAQVVVKRLRNQIQSIFPTWHIALQNEGLSVFHTDDIHGWAQTYSLANQCGVVLGKLFTRRYIDNYQLGDSPPEDPVFDEIESQKTIDSEGRHLIEYYWGRYVAFLTKNTTDTRFILLAPGETPPCYFTVFQGVTIYFSHMEDCAQLNSQPFTINWKYITAHLQFGFTQKGETGLNEVTMLLPGECAIVSPQTSKNILYWDSVKIAQSNIVEDPVAAACELRRTTLGCINAVASGYRRIILRLSGGLDSSIVLGCLKQVTTPAAACLHLISGTTHDDEVELARLAASHAGMDLIEKIMPSPALNLSTAAEKLAITAYPADYQYLLNTGSLEAQLAQKMGADVFFSGQGGDELFFSPPVNLGAIDFAYRNGLCPSLITAAMDSARLCRRSLWSVLRLVIRDRIFKRPTDPYSIYKEYNFGSVIRDEILNSVTLRDIQHPLLDTADTLPPGKFFHVFMLHMPYGLSSSAEKLSQSQWVNPLLSQPLIELCLKIPIYMLTIGARNRGLARQAFVKEVAPRILSRDSKGSGEGYQRLVFDNNIASFREALLDGVLVKENLLDRHKLEDVMLGDNHSNVPINYADLNTYFHLEIWLKKWSDSQLKIAV